MSSNSLDRSAFERAVGLSPGKLDNRTSGLLDEAQLRFASFDKAGQAQLEAATEKDLERFEKDDKKRSTEDSKREEIWQKAWREQLERFESADYNLKALNPKFFDGSKVLRWHGGYIEKKTTTFELDFYEILRDWLFRQHLGDIGHLYEFGSGSGFNVAAYARLFPSVPITALDWAPPAAQIADLLRERHGMKITGRKFDFFKPDYTLKLAPNSGVLTMCALEQVGERFAPILDYFLANRPKRVVHVEPILELYDPASSYDRLAIRYHKHRKYLAGFLPALETLEREKKIKITFKKRLEFGSQYHECLTAIVWEPV